MISAAVELEGQGKAVGLKGGFVVAGSGLGLRGLVCRRIGGGWMSPLIERTSRICRGRSVFDSIEAPEFLVKLALDMDTDWCIGAGGSAVKGDAGGVVGIGGEWLAALSDDTIGSMGSPVRSMNVDGVASLGGLVTASGIDNVVRALVGLRRRFA